MNQTVIIILAILVTLALTYGVSMVLTRKKNKAGSRNR